MKTQFTFSRSMALGALIGMIGVLVFTAVFKTAPLPTETEADRIIRETNARQHKLATLPSKNNTITGHRLGHVWGNQNANQ